MPKFVGNPGTAHLSRHNQDAGPGLVRLTYAQARLLPACDVACSLDTTDRGSKNSLAKRWYRWFARPDTILGSGCATPAMRLAANYAVNGLLVEEAARMHEEVLR
jgi:hypothetical protein